MTDSAEIKTMKNSRNFLENTCPASRHAQIIAEALTKGEKYSMLEEDPEHCAESIASVVSSLYQTRTFLKEMGYDWRVSDDQTVEWYKTDGGDYPGRARRDNMSNPGDLDYEV